VPKRSNEFQALLAYLYQVIAPTGATVTESALLSERDGGAQREVDILIEHEVAGHPVLIAIECRDRRRQETVEWIDGLIGKYATLPVDKVVAVTSAKFSAAAKAKAAASRIDLMNAEDARKIEWAAHLMGPWKTMRHSHTLMRITVVDTDEKVVAESNTDESGTVTTYRDEFSASVCPDLKRLFFEKVSKSASEQLEAKIAENWQAHADNPVPRWAEFTLNAVATEIEIRGRKATVGKVVFGVGTLFDVQEQVPSGYVLNERLVQEIQPVGADEKLRWVMNTRGEIEGIQFLKNESKRRRAPG